MLELHPFQHQMAERAERGFAVHVPMVYEQVAREPMHWEYHVVKIDTRETALPDADQLNALGKEGWILVDILDERAVARGVLVYYYFVRQQA